MEYLSRNARDLSGSGMAALPAGMSRNIPPSALQEYRAGYTACQR